MGNTNFGIHMNAEEFERIYDEQQSETRRVLFRNGISHEYFHHIVDTWCVINEINQGKLRKRYEKQMHAEYINNEYFILEESMGEHLAYKWTGSDFGFVRKGTYSLWQSITSTDVWLEGSLIVALQYLKGKYKISGLTPDNGFTPKNLETFKVPNEWRERVPHCKLFPLDGNDAGFGTHHETGVWNFANIPFHVHHHDGEVRERYFSMKNNFYQQILSKDKR